MAYSMDPSTDLCYEGTACLINKFSIKDPQKLSELEAQITFAKTVMLDYLYILDENNLPRISYIKTNGQTENGEWIVSSGVNNGDKIITSGLQKVIPGKPVRIVDPNAQPVAPKKVSIWDKVKNLFN